MPYFIKDNGNVLGSSISSQSNSMAVGDYSVTREIDLTNKEKKLIHASVFDKLQKGKWGEANFYEEYAIECLFHESVHSHQIRPLLASRFSADYAIHEVCTQMYARENYQKILSLFGAEPNHQLMIRINGLGYKGTCNTLRTFLQNPNGTMNTELLRSIAICEKEPALTLRELLVKRGYSVDEIDRFILILGKTQ